MKYYETRFKIHPCTQDGRDLLAALVADTGYDSFEETDSGLSAFIKADLYNPIAIDTVLENFPLQGVEITYLSYETEDKNWNEQWELNGFEPICIGKECIIYDAKQPIPDIPAGSNPLMVAIDAQQAFGTGNHETTRMIVAHLLSTDLNGKRVLDCGCGTGILGIVAAMRGATEVVGYDIDDWSVKNSQHNAKLNGVEMEVLEGDKSVLSHINGMFDIILANINRNILLNDMNAFSEVMTTGAQLILSGFYEEDSQLLLECAERLNLHETCRMTENNWCALVLTR